MKIIGVIPARYNSSRLPGKPLMLIKNKPMIQRVHEQAKKSKLLDRIIVATDDKRIQNFVQSINGEAVMTSDKHKSGTDRICEAVSDIECDLVVNIQGDEPFIDPKNIDEAIKVLVDDKSVNTSTLATRLTQWKDLLDMNKVKVVIDINNYALYFSRHPIPFDNKHTSQNSVLIKSKFYKHIGLYVYRKNFLLKFSKMKESYLEGMERLEQLRILENGEKIKVAIVKKDSISIDTPEDINLFNQSIQTNVRVS